MKRTRGQCTVCDFTPVNFSGWWSFLPYVCCESTQATRKAGHKRGSKK